MLELLVSIGLVAALIFAMASFLGDALHIRERVGASVARGLAAEAVIGELERALTTCVVDDRGLGAGVQGDDQSITIVSCGIATWRVGGDAPSRALDERERMQLAFDPARKAISIARGDGAKADVPGEIGLVRLRYRDGTTWVDEFDSVTARRLPRAVEVSIWLHAPRDPEEVAPDRQRVIAIPDSAANESADAPSPAPDESATSGNSEDRE